MSSASVTESAKLTWPLFPSPSLSSLHVTGYEVYNGTPYYVIVITMSGGFRWSVLKSYDEIAFLNKQLIENYAIDKTLFPQRKMFGGQQTREIQERLGIYFSNLLIRFTLPPLLLLRFLEYKFSDILSITETLSALFYDKGREFLETNSMVAFSPLQLHCICKRMILPIVSEQKDVRFEFGHLLEFLHHLKKVKVCPPSRELFPLSPTIELSFDLSVMKALDTLVLNTVDLSLVQSLGNIPLQLLTLGVHRGLNSLRDILKHTSLGIDQDSESGYVQWTALRVMDLSYNSISSIDTSLKLCPNLEELNLSHNTIKDIDNILDLPHLRILDLSYNELPNVSDLHYRLGNITTLCLAHNRLSCLSGLEKCYSIVCLDIQYNLITKVGEIGRLVSLPILEQLMVKGNAFSASPSYRQQIFSLLPKTARQVSLDGKPPTRDELEVSASISIEGKQKSIKRHKKGSIRKVEVIESEDGDGDGSTTHDSPAVPSLAAGTRRHMEEMRKEGGENWLKMLNQQQQISPKQPKRKHRHKKTPTTVESSSPSTESSVPHSFYETPSSGLPSAHLQELVKERECNSPWSCSALVVQYSGNFRQLSHHGIEKLLTDRACDSCLLEVDINVGKIIEDFAVAGGSGGNRRTRDLAFLKDIRCHEGKNLAISIELTALMGHNTWIIYSIKDYPSMADLYVLLQKRLHSTSEAVIPSQLSKQLSAGDSDNNTDSVHNTDSAQEDKDLVSSSNHHSPPSPSPSPLPPSQPLPSQSTNPFDDSNSTPTVPIELPSTHTSSDNIIATGNVTQDGEVVGSLAMSPTMPVNIEYFVASSSIVNSSNQKSARFAMTPSLGRVNKPSFEDDTLHAYFKQHVAKENSGEMLMYVLWCGICLSSTFPYELPGVIMISNTSLYLAEITEQGSERGSWDSQKFPLSILISEQLEHLSRIMLTGVVDRSVYVELHNRSPMCSFVLFPPTAQLTSQLFEQLKAALDAASLHYTVMETYEAKTVTGLSGVLLIIPDDFSTKRYKQWLAVSKTRVKLANFVASHKNKTLLGMYSVELNQGVRELAEKIDIISQLVVNVFCNDILPGTNGGSHLQPLTLILTSSRIFLCEESFISGPGLRLTQAKHAFPPLTIVQSLPLNDVLEVIVCDNPLPVGSSDCFVYQVELKFESAIWYFGVHDLHYFRTFLNNLKLLQSESATPTMEDGVSLKDDRKVLKIVNVSTELESFPRPSDPIAFISSQYKLKTKSGPPLFFRHLPLLRYAALPHWAKSEVFKEHIAQGDFMKSDEIILSLFLAHSQPHLEKRLDVEVMVIISNYAIYFLSDTDGIRTWLDSGGVSSFARMSLLSAQDDTHLQCFYRLWLSDLIKVHVGPLSLSFRVHDGKSNTYIDVLTNSSQSTALAVSVLSGTVGFKEKLKEKDVERILSEYADITDDPFGENTPADRSLPPIIGYAKLSAVELVLSNEFHLDELKLHLVESQPEVARGSSVKNCSESIQILYPAIMLLKEKVRIRDSVTDHYRPHLVLLTNFGIFMCASSLNPDVTPSLLVLTPSQLVVKRWIRIDDITSILVDRDIEYVVPRLNIQIRSPSSTTPSTPSSITSGMVKNGSFNVCLIPFTSLHGDTFVTYLALMWKERMGQVLTVKYAAVKNK